MIAHTLRRVTIDRGQLPQTSTAISVTSQRGNCFERQDGDGPSSGLGLCLGIIPNEAAKDWRGKCCNRRMKKHEDEETRTYDVVSTTKEGLGPNSAGQSGDTQGLSDVAEADSESVEELLEEGQSFEAEVISGIENAPDADVSEVHTRQKFRRTTFLLSTINNKSDAQARD